MYQKLILHELPRIRFAHSYSTAGYDMRIPAGKDRLELSFLDRGDVIRESADSSALLLPEGCFSLYSVEQESHFYSHSPLCSHITVGFEAAHEFQPVSLDEVLSANRPGERTPSAVYCPTGALVPEKNASMEVLIRRLISLFSLPDAARELKCIALLFDLLAALTEETVQIAVQESGGLSASGILYARQAMRYISSHLQEKLSTDLVATRLSISSGYLGTVFRAYTGTSVVSYINSIRVERIRELLTTRRLRLREAGESVGLTDENYISRLFKQYTGLSVREYQRSLR